MSRTTKFAIGELVKLVVDSPEPLSLEELAERTGYKPGSVNANLSLIRKMVNEYNKGRPEDEQKHVRVKGSETATKAQQIWNVLAGA